MPYVRGWLDGKTKFRDLTFTIVGSTLMIDVSIKGGYSNEFVGLDSKEAAKARAEDFAIKTYFLPALPPMIDRVLTSQERSVAIREYTKASKTWSQYLRNRINVMKPDLQLFLDHPGYIWVPMDVFSNVYTGPINVPVRPGGPELPVIDVGGPV